MLCIGSVYAWSIVASELIKEYSFSAFQTQLTFGILIAIFPVTMIFVGQLEKRVKHRYFGYISGSLFLLGYLLASYSKGNFVLIFISIGILGGIATGFGYWVALTTPVQWFPQKKGLIAGIAAAGFGLGAVIMSEMSEIILKNGNNVLQLLKIVGIIYGLVIFIFSNLIYQTQSKTDTNKETLKLSDFIVSKTFRNLFVGIFLGTFAGLLIIGSLGIIGDQHSITNHILILGVALFAFANFSGRLIWGFISDYLGASLSIFLALLFQAISIISLNIFPLTDISYLVLALFIGFGFGGNFVLFAKETAQVFGLGNLGVIYPYVFVGYAIAGIAGPISGGILHDFSDSFFYAIILAGFMSFLGSLLFLNQFITSKKNDSFK